tara:strand:+ start:969 stop:1295 length:327 start_codon:yes stop_codon:yes gene_type:complete
VQLIKLKGDLMRKNLLLVSLAVLFFTSSINAAGSNFDNFSKNTLTSKNIENMKKLHREITQGAASEVGMEARRKLILSEKDGIYHKMVKTGDISLSKTEKFSTDQFDH